MKIDTAARMPSPDSRPSPTGKRSWHLGLGQRRPRDEPRIRHHRKRESEHVDQPLARALLAIDADTMIVVDSSSPRQPDRDADWTTTPILFNDANGAALVGAINKDGFYYALNRNNLAAGYVWRRQIGNAGPDPESGDASVSSSAFGGGRLYVRRRHHDNQRNTVKGSIRALNPTTGTVLWERGLQRRTDGPGPQRARLCQRPRRRNLRIQHVRSQRVQRQYPQDLVRHEWKLQRRDDRER